MNHLCRFTLLSLLMGPTFLNAATISTVNIVNTSAPDSISPVGVGRYGEFATQTNLGAVNISGDTASFTHQMQFYNGYFIGPGGPTVALTHQRNVSYDLTFTVEDPTNIGYSLEIETLLRGYSTAQWTFGGSNNAVVATGATFSGRIDTDTTDATDTLGIQINSLTIGTGGATANATNTFTNNLGQNTDFYSSLAFSGTREFALRFTTFGSGNTNIFLQNGQQGQGSVRFGLANADSTLNPSGQPGGDAFTPNNLGHFVTVNAVFNEIIPEPATSATAFIALASAGVRRRR